MDVLSRNLTLCVQATHIFTKHVDTVIVLDIKYWSIRHSSVQLLYVMSGAIHLFTNDLKQVK